MKPFDALPYNGQIRRMRQLAQAALVPYRLSHARLRLLQHLANTTFCVEEGGGPGEEPEGASSAMSRYVLRIHRTGPDSLLRSRSELLWLEALRRDTELVVPEPVRARDGSLAIVAQAPGVPSPRCCVLFHWIDGEFRDARLTPKDLAQVGAFLANLHKYAEQFVPPPTFDRVRLDATHMFNSDWVATALSKGALLLAPSDARVIQTVIARARNVARELGEGTDVFGLVHGDFQQGNYLFHKGEVRAIDFDTCHFGYYLYDIATTLGALTEFPAFLEMRSAFFRGYRKVRPLACAYTVHLDTFIAARRATILLWILGNVDHLGVHEGVADDVRRALRDLKVVLEEDSRANTT